MLCSWVGNGLTEYDLKCQAAEMVVAGLVSPILCPVSASPASAAASHHQSGSSSAFRIALATELALVRCKA